MQIIMTISGWKQVRSAAQSKGKIRLKHKESDATALPYTNNETKILFDEPQMSIMQGQSAVLYSNCAVFGGGIIVRAF